MSVVSAPPDDGKEPTYVSRYLGTSVPVCRSVGSAQSWSRSCVSRLAPPRTRQGIHIEVLRPQGRGGAPIWAGTDLAASLLSLDLLLPVAGGSGRILWVVGISAVERVPVPLQSAAPEANPPIRRAAEMPFSIAPCRIRRISADVPSCRLQLPATSCNRLHSPLCSE